MKIGKRSVRLGMAVAAVAATLGARAAVWTGGVDGPWSAGGNWDGGSGAPPVSGPTTQLMFSNAGTGYTTTNDLGPFTFNALTLDNTGTGLVTVAGNPLTLDGSAATMVGTGAGDKLVKNNLTFAVDSTVTNTGGTMTIGAADATDDLWIDAAPWTEEGAVWKKVSSIRVPETNAICGDDIALLVLRDAVSPSEAVPARPATDEAAFARAIESRVMGLAAFGVTSPSAEDVGTRRSRFDIPLRCVPGRPGFACEGDR